MKASRKPVVLDIAGHDPSGGAGMLADCETITALGGYPVAAVTAVTAQDTRNAYAVWPMSASQVSEQISHLCDDLAVSAVKIGLLATADIAREVAASLENLDVPIVLDPVLVAAGGAQLAEKNLADILLEKLVPIATVVTPNAFESVQLGGDDPGESAKELLARGCEAVLIKGGDAPTADVVNRLFVSGETETFVSPRHPGQFHGSGCTLASAIATFLARGYTTRNAVVDALAFMERAIATASQPGSGQFVPNRQAARSDGERA